jgi:hypothetical protein
MAKSNLHALAELGQSVWIDYLSRELIQSGELERMMGDDAVTGVTSNPTIFQKAISSGDAYDEQLKELLEEHSQGPAAFFKLAERDISDACDLLRPVWEATGGHDGYVSIEVDPNIAYDTKAQFDQARELHETIDRPNLFVKIPGTEPGLQAIEDSIAEGRSINVTLIFSLQRYDEVAKAYIGGIERLLEAGGDPSASIPRRTSDWRRSAPRLRSRSAASSRSRTPSSPTSAIGSSSPASAGTSWSSRGRPGSAACGHPPPSRIRTTGTPCTSRS